jgi:hypothetical protein
MKTSAVRESPKTNLPVARRRDSGASRLFFGGNAYRMSTLSRHRASKVSESFSARACAPNGLPGFCVTTLVTFPLSGERRCNGRTDTWIQALPSAASLGNGYCRCRPRGDRRRLLSDPKFCVWLNRLPAIPIDLTSAGPVFRFRPACELAARCYRIAATKYRAFVR